MVVLHPYAEAPAYRDRQARTWDRLAAMDPWFQSQGWRVVHAPNGVDTRYEDAVRALWGRDDLLICEADMAPQPVHWHGMAACPYPVCAQWYWMAGRVFTPHRRQLPRHRWEIWAGRCRYGDRWAQVTGFGFIRFRQDLQQAVGTGWSVGTWDGRYHPGLPWAGVPWGLDYRVTAWCTAQGFSVHLHYPPIANHHPIAGSYSVPEEA